MLTGVDALTPSEERVCRLAADGMTNRQIADHLFVTVKTIEMHLANAFGKLAIESRRDLAGVVGTTDSARGDHGGAIRTRGSRDSAS